MKLRHIRVVLRMFLNCIFLGLAAVLAFTSRSAFAQSAVDDATLQQGQRVFVLCLPCHSSDQGAPNKIGPNLWGIFGRKAGANADYKFYSDALRSSGITWSEETMDKWLVSPKDMVPGTKMVFRGIDSPDNRKALIAFLKQQTGATK